MSIGAFCMNPLMINSPIAFAEYRSQSDTGTTIFDYIENRRRERREKALTDEQKQLLKDMDELRARLPDSASEDESVPAAFEGDDLTYNTATGEFWAVGNVDVIQLDGHRFQASEMDGNLETQDIRIEGKAHILQFTENAPRVSLDGYNTVYNYGTKMGTMDNVKGKAAGYYISGKRFEFYPDHMVAYDATQTRCGAKKPDYHLSAKRMEIWPEQIIRMYDVKFWLGNVVVGTKEYEERDLDSGESAYLPHIGYDSDYGLYAEDSYNFPIHPPHFVGVVNAHIDTSDGVRSNVEAYYVNRNIKSGLSYGFYHDTDGKWLQKVPSLETVYSKHFDYLPLTYTFRHVVGEWSQEDNSSLHSEYEAGLRHDPILLGKRWLLFLGTGYKITTEDVKTSPERFGDTTVKGFSYDGTLAREFDDRFAAYVSYQYSKNNSRNSLFDFDMDSYSSKFESGISYRLTDKDRFVVGMKFNAANGDLEDADYFWYRDLHCSTMVVRWRQKRQRWTVHWQFTPW